MERRHEDRRRLTPAEADAEFAAILADCPVAARVERRLAERRKAAEDAEHAVLVARYWPNGFPE
jgi:hypothetical protein